MIIDAIEEAYIYAQKKGWPTLYWLVDIHSTIAESNYADEMPSLIQEAVPAIQELQSYSETCLILWSSCYKHDHLRYMRHFLIEGGMKFTYFNENPEIVSTATGDFSMKPYFNVLIDDKAGFRRNDWKMVVEAVRTCRAKYPLAKPKVDDYLLR